MTRCGWLLGFLLIFASTAQAQVVQTYTVRTYLVGAAQPFSAPATVQAADFVCNQPRIAVTGPVQNPTKLLINDLANATPNRDCVWTDPGTGFLFAMPFGIANYEITLTATNTAGTSPESARSNSFTRSGVLPSVPQGVRVGG